MGQEKIDVLGKMINALVRAKMRPLVRLAFAVTATLIAHLAAIQKSDAASFEQLAPTAITFAFGAGLDFGAFSGTAPGDVTAQVQFIGGTGLGCAASDYAGFPVGGIALIERGTCSFSEKLEIALAAGAGLD
jgi:hypothetical protein